MIRAWMSKLWHRDGLPKAVDIPPRPLYNHDPSKAIGRVSKIEPTKCGGVEFSIELEESLMRLGRAMNPTLAERAKMKQVREYKDSAMLGQNKKPVFCSSYEKHNCTFGKVL